MPGQHVTTVAADAQTGVTVRRAVGHRGIGNAAGILHAGPERAAGRADVVFVQRRGALPTGARIVHPVLLGVAVTAEDQHVRKPAQQREQPRAIGVAEGVAAFVLEQRNMHRQHQQALLRYARQIGFEKRELVVAQAADVRRALTRPIDHVVEAHEHRFVFFPREGVGAEGVAEGQQRVFVARDIEVQIVIAGDVQPRHADAPGLRVQGRIQRQLVVDDIAQAQSKLRGTALRTVGGHAFGKHAVDDVAGVVIDIRGRLDLRIGEHPHLQPAVARWRTTQADIETARHRAGCDPPVLQRRRRERRHMPPGAGTRQVVLRHAPTRGFDGEHRLPRRDRNAVTPGRIGFRQRAAVRDQNARDPGFAAIAPAVAVAVVVDHAAEQLAGRCWRIGRRGARGARGAEQQAQHAYPFANPHRRLFSVRTGTGLCLRPPCPGHRAKRTAIRARVQ